MDPMTIMAGLQATKGIYDIIQGSQYGNKKRPEFEIPLSTYQALGLAKDEANKRNVVGDIMRTGYDQQTADAIAKAKESLSPSQMVATMGNIQDSQNKGLHQAALTDATLNRDAKNTYMGQLGNMAQWENKAWEWNEAQPYLTSMHTAADFEGAGMQNMFSGMESFMANEQSKNEWSNIFRLAGIDMNEQEKTAPPTPYSQGSLSPLAGWDGDSDLLKILFQDMVLV